MAKELTDKQRCENSLPDFAVTYLLDVVQAINLDLYYDPRTGYKGVHREWLEDLQKAVEQGFENYGRVVEGNWRFIIAPRGFAKSSCVRILICWLACYPHKLRFPEIINLSFDAEKARENLGVVKEWLLNNELIKEDFGEFKGPERKGFTWNVADIKTQPGPGRISIRIRVYGQEGIRSKHPGIVIIDDFEEMTDTTLSDEARKKLSALFARDVCAAVTVKKPMIYVGTLLDENSILTKIARGPDNIIGQPLFPWSGREWTCWRIKEKESIWPKVWPVKLLLAERSAMNGVSDGAFEFEYENDVRMKGNVVWREEWWGEDTIPPPECKLGEYNATAGKWISFPGTQHITVFDPATSLKTRADFTACLTGVVITDMMHPLYGHAWLVEDWRDKLDVNDVMLAMEKQIERFVGYCGIERSQGGTFYEILKHRNSQLGDRGVRILPLDPWGSTPFDRAKRGQYLVQTKRIHRCPWISKNFRREVAAFPNNRPNHDDQATTLAYFQQVLSEQYVALPVYTPPREKTRQEQAIERYWTPKEDPDQINIGESDFPSL